jgi:serine/threonine-protein kinase
MLCPACRLENEDKAAECVGCGRALAPRTLVAGDVVASRYEILSALGAGGMGVVYKANDRALDETVALKVLLADASKDPSLARRFRSEIKLAWKVRHKNVCGIHEYGEDGELLYISMELVEGHDLGRLLRDGGPFNWGEAYDVAEQAATGLVAIHDAGVIHRDLKPANITRDAHGVVRLMDFGIAKVWGEKSSAGVTSTGKVAGSPGYMSPEQMRGTELDFRSDVYALGLVIYELFTGQQAFRAATPVAAMLRRLEEEIAFDGPEAALVPVALVPVLRGALARDRNQRYRSSAELLAALKQARSALAEQPTDELLLPAEHAHRAAAARVASAPSPHAASFSLSAQARLLVPHLCQALTHGDDAVRRGAAQALGRTGSAAARRSLPCATRSTTNRRRCVRKRRARSRRSGPKPRRPASLRSPRRQPTPCGSPPRRRSRRPPRRRPARGRAACFACGASSSGVRATDARLEVVQPFL